MKTFLAVCLAVFYLASGRCGATRYLPITRAKSNPTVAQTVTRFGEGEIPKEQIAKIGQPFFLFQTKRLQRHTIKTSKIYIYTAFTLAYFEADYKPNLHRLIYPVDMWLANARETSMKYSKLGGGAGMAIFPFLLHRLYLHNHDPNILKTLFAWKLDGYAEECLWNIQQALFKSDTVSVLRCIRHSPQRISNASLSLSTASKADYPLICNQIDAATEQNRDISRRFVKKFLAKIDAERIRIRNPKFSGSRGTQRRIDGKSLVWLRTIPTQV